MTWRRIEQEDFGYATILGVVCNEDLLALGSWMNRNFSNVLDFSLLRNARLETYPGWLFEYPADCYATRPEAQKQISALLKDCPDPRRAKDVIPHYVFAFFPESCSVLPKLGTSLEVELIGKLSSLRREIGLSRRTLFAWILGTMLLTLIDRGGAAVQETAAALRKILFVPATKGTYRYPAGLYDPKLYLENLIAMFEAIAKRINPEHLRSMKFFKLTSPSILRGRLDDGTWQTVYAYCGGWRTYPFKALCGNNSIVRASPASKRRGPGEAGTECSGRREPGVAGTG